MGLKQIDISLRDRVIPFYFKETKKETGIYYTKILKGEIYKKLKFILQPNLIIDLGANIGSASIFFSLNYPNSNILSFEPVLETYKILQKNTKYFKKIKIFNLAISDKSGFSKMYIDTEKAGRSSLIENHLNFKFQFLRKSTNN